MTSEHFDFTFGNFKSSAHITGELPGIEEIAADFGGDFFKPLIICDRNTENIARKICGSGVSIPVCVLEAGEEHKNWQAVENILRSARAAGIGRDGTFIGVGGGVIGDLCAFAASIYMRGCSLALVSTTLLGMVDASLGGKTGFDLFDVKNIAGTFYPARHVYMPVESLRGLPPREWKSGMAELIKTAILDGDDFVDDINNLISQSHQGTEGSEAIAGSSSLSPCLGNMKTDSLARCISRAVRFKGGIVEEDPRETGGRRMLLNLGHTFGHALESAAGLGTISHGEAVAWGIARSCDLGLSLGICPQARADTIQALLNACAYETSAPHPLMRGGRGAFLQALSSDKKKRGGSLTFIVPDAGSARSVPVALDSLVVCNI